MTSIDNKIIPCGILNVGSTCYLNSLLQTMASIKNIDWNNVYDKYNNDLQPISKFLLKIIHILQNEGGKTLNIKEFTDSLRELFQKKGLQVYYQNDPMEIIDILLDIPIPTLNIEKIKPEYIIADISNVYKFTPKTLLEEVFGGVLVNILYKQEDKIIKKEYRCEPFYYIFIQTRNIIEGLDNYFKTEDVSSNDFNKVKQYIITPPEILYIFVKCYDNDGNKINNEGEISVNRKINISKYCMFIKNAEYSLKSMIIHQGHNIYSGHYTTILLRDDTYYHIDDDNVNKLDKFYGNIYCYVYELNK